MSRLQGIEDEAAFSNIRVKLGEAARASLLCVNSEVSHLT